MNARRSEDGLAFYLSGGGFSYAYFNKAGKMDMWKVSKHFESIRAVLFQHYLRDALQINSASGAFMRFQKIELLPEFHTTVGVNTAWVMKTELSFVGTTSFWLESTTRCQKTGVPLLRNLCQEVRVDRSTRRPIKLQKEALAAYHQPATSPVAPWFEFPVTKADADKVFKMSTTALPSDTDLNRHVNQSVCIQYCLNCASLAAMQGDILHHFTTDMAFYDAKSFSVWYIGELHVGDEVEVECWEDRSNVCTLYFIVKTRGSVVYQCVGEWYEHESAGSFYDLLKKSSTDTTVIPESKL